MRRGYFLLFLFWAACSTDSMPSITLRGSNTLRGARVLQSFGARGRVCMRFAGGFSGQNFEGEDDTSSSILPCETTTDEEENRESMASDSSTFSSELGWPEDKGGGESAEWEDDDDPGSRRRGTRKGKGGRQRQLARQSREGETNTGGQDDEEGVRNFIKREQARIRETMGVEGLAANEEAARLAHEDFVPHDARMSEVEMEALRNFTWEMDLNSTYQVKITEEGDNPYFMNHLFGDAGEEGGEGGVEDVLGRDLEEKIPAQGEGEENEDDSSGVKLPEWDGQNRFIGSDGVVYIADQRNLDHVDERGFDEDDNIYPFKDLGDRRFIQLLHEQSAKDQELIRELDAAEKRELEETGDVARYNWRKHLDEDGYLRPDCLQKNSTFLRENPWVNRHYVVPSPTPLRWRGRRIDVAEIGGAAAEWDILCNSAYADRATTFTAFRHTGVGCTIMLPHHGSG